MPNPYPFSISFLASLVLSNPAASLSYKKKDDEVDLAIRQRALEAANNEYRRVISEMKHKVERKSFSK
jgi:hypothetical protein